MDERMNDTFEIDLKQLLEVAIARIKLIIFIIFVFGVSAFLISKFVLTPMYTTSATMYVNNNKTSTSQNISISDIDTGRELVGLYSEFIESDTVLEQVAATVSNETDIAFTAKDIRSMLSSGAVNDTALMSVTVTSPSPEISQIIANAVADIAPDRITEFMEGSSVKVVDYAKLPEYPSSPNVTKNTAMGLVLGAVVAFGLVFIMELTDTRIKNEEDLKKLVEYPVIGIIPEILIEDEEETASKN
jgi:capsular polysaccharide biosynthesis protein